MQPSTYRIWKVLYQNNQLLTKIHVELEDNSIGNDKTPFSCQKDLAKGQRKTRDPLDKNKVPIPFVIWLKCKGEGYPLEHG